jgi:hypothetical protein
MSFSGRLCPPYEISLAMTRVAYSFSKISAIALRRLRA